MWPPLCVDITDLMGLRPVMKPGYWGQVEYCRRMVSKVSTYSNLYLSIVSYYRRVCGQRLGHHPAADNTNAGLDVEQPGDYIVSLVGTCRLSDTFY